MTVLISALLILSIGTMKTAEPASFQSATQQQHQIVTAAQANGVYRYYQSEFRILALGHNKLKVQFDGVHPTAGGSVNIGYAMGEAIIEGNIATFKPPETERCEITLVFLKNKLKIEQDGSDADCGFGHNVFATGTYRKVKSGKPKFESPEGPSS